jgi:choline dehydrogenase-like flavoprotein
MAERYYFGGGGFQTASMDMTLAFARALGGSTTVYTGVTFKPPESALAKWNVPGIDRRDLDPRLDKYLAENNVHALSDGEINRNNRLFADACRKLGWSLGQFPINVKGCGVLGTCNLGCARLAKQGTAVVQIPVAEANGVEVITFCRALRVGDGVVECEVRPPEHGLAPSRLEPGRYRMRARAIVVAGGSINTSALLLRSFGTGGAGVHPALGRYFTCHPALALVAEHAEPVEGTIGHPKSYYCDEFTERDRFLLETCMYYPFITAKGLAGFGAEPDELLARFDRLQQILVLVLDDARAENRVTIDAHGDPVVHYELDAKVVQALVKAIRASGRIFFAAGARRAALPAAGRFFTDARDAERLDEIVRVERFRRGQVAVSAAHLMGGCRMGEDPRAAVCDPWGRVHGRRGLYVADGSLFPGSVEVNPYLTIMALADRVAEAVRGDLARG